MTRKRAAAGRGGLSLIEVIVALAVLAAVLTGVTQVFHQGQTHVRGAGMSVVAVNLARAKMENLSDSAFAGLADSDEAYNSIPGFGDYRRQTRIAPVSGYGVSELRRIDVTVYWDQDNRQVSLSTLRSN